MNLQTVSLTLIFLVTLSKCSLVYQLGINLLFIKIMTGAFGIKHFSLKWKMKVVNDEYIADVLLLPLMLLYVTWDAIPQANSPSGAPY